MAHEDIQMLPCCGYFYIPDETNDTVIIGGCPNGIDWTVLHVASGIEIIIESGEKVFVDTGQYQKTVCRFADEIKEFYQQCSPKTMPADDFEKNGYYAFWKEWERRRNSLQQCGGYAPFAMAKGWAKVLFTMLAWFVVLAQNAGRARISQTQQGHFSFFAM